MGRCDLSEHRTDSPFGWTLNVACSRLRVTAMSLSSPAALAWPVRA
jgi:hypothetical protein